MAKRLSRVSRERLRDHIGTDIYLHIVLKNKSVHLVKIQEVSDATLTVRDTGLGTKHFALDDIDEIWWDEWT